MTRVVICAVVLLLFVGLVGAAFGVNSACDGDDCYWDGRPLILESGESRKLYFGLQNAEEEDITLRVELTSGSEIAVLRDENLEYVVSPGSRDVKINVDVQIPEDAEVGEEYNVGILVRQVPSGEGGMVQISGSIGNSFSVIVGEVLFAEDEEEVQGKSKIAIILLASLTALSLIVLIILAYVLVRSRKITSANL